jgi:hypothetical protein
MGAHRRKGFDPIAIAQQNDFITVRCNLSHLAIGQITCGAGIEEFIRHNLGFSEKKRFFFEKNKQKTFAL